MKYNLPKLDDTEVISDSTGKTYLVRSAKDSDVRHVTGLIHEAFEGWKLMGLRLSPMYQTDHQTRAHLIGKGFVVVAQNNEIIGTFSLEIGKVELVTRNRIQFTEGSDEVVFDGSTSNRPILPNGRLLIFKKAAVRSDLAASGLGAQFYQLAEGWGRTNGFDGMILETVREAEWLYNWYSRLGFQPIGNYQYPGSKVETILMLKLFSKENK